MKNGDSLRNCCENMVFERLLKLSVVGKISVEKFGDFGVLFASGIIMARVLCTMLLHTYGSRKIFNHFYVVQVFAI